MKIYNYHPNTKELLGENEASLDPLETKNQKKDVYLLPAYATFSVPTACEKNKVVVFQAEKWQIISDFRGSKYYLQTGEEITITEIGATIPKDALLEPPLPPEPTEADLNEIKIQAKIREMAIESLKASDSEFPKNYK